MWGKVLLKSDEVALCLFNQFFENVVIQANDDVESFPRLEKFPGLQCTSLFYFFSKMNHSCEANTFCVAGGNRVRDAFDFLN